MSDDRRGVLPRARALGGGGGGVAARAADDPPPGAGGRRAGLLRRPTSSATRASSCCPSGQRAAQLALRDASVLVVGAGALGSPVAAYLAGAGVGRLGIVDADEVELSNLHAPAPALHARRRRRQGRRARRRSSRFLNPEVVVEPYQARLDAAALLEGADLVVDCSDSFETRYAVNAACCAARIPLVEGGVVGMSGLVMAIRPGESACYRCAFPEPPPPGSAPTCAEAGVLGPAAGVIGSLQALEALRLLARLDGALLDAFLQVDLARPRRSCASRSSRRDGLSRLCHAVAHDRHPDRGPRARGAAPRRRRRPRARPRRARVSALEILATWPGVHALLAHRVAHALDEAGVPLAPRAIAYARARGHRDRDPPVRRRSATACSSTTGWAS